MKVIIAKDELTKGLQMCVSAVAQKTTLPILSNFLFETEGNKIKLSATDLETGITCYLKAEIVEEGSITIPAKKFSDIIKELPNTDIEIKADKTNQINIKVAKSKFVLMGLATDDYPKMPQADTEKGLQINTKTFADMLKKTIFAVSKDQQRYVLNGVYVCLENGKMEVVATDGKRLAYITDNYENTQITGQAIIPTKAANEIIKLLTFNPAIETATIYFGQTNIVVQVADVTLVTNLIEGKFPNYKQILPTTELNTVKLNVPETTAAVKQVALFTIPDSISNKVAAIKFMFDKNTMKVLANTSTIGSGEYETNIEFDKPKFSVLVNPVFATDVLKNITDENMLFSYTTSNAPVFISPTNNKNYICVIMPIKE